MKKKCSLFEKKIIWAILIFLPIAIILFFSCKKKEIILEPGYVLQKWALAIEKLDYYKYSSCEAYPKDAGVFREIYKNEYFSDLAIFNISNPDKKNIRKDYKGDSYISCSAEFEGSIVKRAGRESFQTVKGNVVFIKFLDGEKSKNGWLILNRIITRIKR